MKAHLNNFLSKEPEISESILNSLKDQICLIDTAGIIRFVNNGWIRGAISNGGTLASCGVGTNYLQQCKEEPHLYQGLQAVLEEHKDFFNFEYPCHSPTEKRWFLMQATPLYLNEIIQGLVIRHVDITKQKLMELQLKEYAEKDVLTSLYNRRYFEKRLTKEISHALLNNKSVSLLYIDTDNFKDINDAYGHLAGDHVLKELANQIMEVVKPSDTAARIGGDEFAVILPDADQAQLEYIANSLIQSIQNLSIHYQNSLINVTVSIGGKSFMGNIPLSSIIEWVDKALYLAKDKGKDRVVII